jgi:hypothetical protein
MSESGYPRIVFSERLSTGIVVHFEDGGCAFFPTAFLHEQRSAPHILRGRTRGIVRPTSQISEPPPEL